MENQYGEEISWLECAFMALMCAIPFYLVIWLFHNLSHIGPYDQQFYKPGCNMLGNTVYIEHYNGTDECLVKDGSGQVSDGSDLAQINAFGILNAEKEKLRTLEFQKRFDSEKK